MSRLECLGKPSAVSQKQSTIELTSIHAETHKPDDTVGEKKVTDKPRSLPANARPRSVQVSCQETIKSEEVLNGAECAPKESVSITPRIEEQAQSTAVPDEELKRTGRKRSQPPYSAVTGGRTHVSPPVEPLPMHKANGDEEDAEDEDLKAPVALKLKFLRALGDKDLQLASKLCQMILIYEPDDPEASEFLPLIRKKLLEEPEVEQSSEDDEEDDDDDEDDKDEDSVSDEESSRSSSCSSSSPSDDDVDNEEEREVNRHKPCPPSHDSP